MSAGQLSSLDTAFCTPGRRPRMPPTRGPRPARAAVSGPVGMERVTCAGGPVEPVYEQRWGRTRAILTGLASKDGEDLVVEAFRAE